jgi:hypothetical protein
MSISNVNIRGVTRYEQLRQVGQGHMTRVYLAASREPADGPTLFALKLLR